MKNGHHFQILTFKVIQLCCLAQKDSFTPKVLKLHFVSVKHGSASIRYVAHSMFDIEAESCLTVINCDFRTFRLKESFWVKQQICITLKVSLQKLCPILFLFVLMDAILLKVDLQKRTNHLDNPANQKLFFYQKCIIYPRVGNIFFIFNIKLI